MSKWVCPFLLSPLFSYNSTWELCREQSRGWVGKGSNGEGSHGMRWFLNCASPSPRIPQRQRGYQDGENCEKGARTWALPQPTVAARAALPSSVSSARWCGVGGQGLSM